MITELATTPEPHATALPHEMNTNYVGFWLRLWGNAADFLLISAIITPILIAIYGPGYLFDGQLVEGQWHIILGGILPALAAFIFLVKRQATPGKMIINAHIVRADNGGKPHNWQFVLRYLVFMVLTPLSLGLSCLWIGWDSRKQSWHDKVAGTVVVKRPQERGH